MVKFFKYIEKKIKGYNFLISDFNYKFVNKKLKEKKYTHQQLAEYLTNNGIETSVGVVHSWFRKDIRFRTKPAFDKISLIASFINENIDTLFTNNEKKQISNIVLNSNNQINGNNNNMIFSNPTHDDELINLVVDNDKIREFLELYINYGNERVLNSFIKKLKELKKISENI